MVGDSVAAEHSVLRGHTVATAKPSKFDYIVVVVQIMAVAQSMLVAVT